VWPFHHTHYADDASLVLGQEHLAGHTPEYEPEHGLQTAALLLALSPHDRDGDRAGNKGVADYDRGFPNLSWLQLLNDDWLHVFPPHEA
jgi:hypothetical protein